MKYLDCDFSDHAPDVLESVWQVKSAVGHGSAFYVGDGQWLTAEHVVAGSPSVGLHHGGRLITAIVTASDAVADVAVLITSSAPDALEFGDLDEIGPGHQSYAVGFPLYDAPVASISRGIISRLETYSDAGLVVLTDAAINPGNSGGPLLNECGQVIGMNIAAREDAVGLNYAVAEATLRRHLGDTASSAGAATTIPPPVTTRAPITPSVPQASDWHTLITSLPSGETMVGIQTYSTDGSATHTIAVECDTLTPFVFASFLLDPATTPPPDNTELILEFSNGPVTGRAVGYSSYLANTHELVIGTTLDSYASAVGQLPDTDGTLQITTIIGRVIYTASFVPQGDLPDLPDCPS